MAYHEREVVMSVFVPAIVKQNKHGRPKFTTMVFDKNEVGTVQRLVKQYQAIGIDCEFEMLEENRGDVTRMRFND